MKLSAKATIYGCYLGYITQAIVNYNGIVI